MAAETPTVAPLSDKNKLTAKRLKKDEDVSLVVPEGGQLLWGQAHTVLEGAGHDVAQDDARTALSAARPGGTILMVDRKYRVSAAAGAWKAKPFTCSGFHAGFVLFNSSVDPGPILQRCAAVGISNSQSHPDKTITYVNRYDWGCHHNPTLEDHGIPEEEEDDDMDDWQAMIRGNMSHGRLFMLLPDHAESFRTALRYDAAFKRALAGPAGIYAIRDSDGNVVGLHVRCDDSEYELAWQVFDKETGDDRVMTAFVYDAAYTALEGDCAI